MLHLNKKKIKITIFTIAMTLAFCQTNAQQQLATLNHNDTITAFYGAGALQQAHAAAVGGDIITLSSGTFNAVNITKAITLRGAGMFADTASNTMATIVVNGYTIDVAQDSIMHLTLEGVRFTGSVSITKLYNAYFSKCKFDNNFIANSNYYCNYAYIVNCIFLGNFQYVNSSIIMNSVIISTSGNYAFRDNPNNAFNNCIMNCYSGPIGHGIFTNCILKGSSGSPSSTSFNCIGMGNNGLGFYGSPIQNNCHNINWTSVFKTFDGTYTEGETFELQDSIANNYLGTDGTQVGIYGGVMPFDPKVGNPKIRRCNVARRSTADGKLSVDIEVVP